MNLRLFSYNKRSKTYYLSFSNIIFSSCFIQTVPTLQQSIAFRCTVSGIFCIDPLTSFVFLRTSSFSRRFGRFTPCPSHMHESLLYFVNTRVFLAHIQIDDPRRAKKTIAKLVFKITRFIFLQHFQKHV